MTRSKSQKSSFWCSSWISEDCLKDFYMPECTELQPWDWLIRYLLISSSTGVPNKVASECIYTQVFYLYTVHLWGLHYHNEWNAMLDHSAVLSSVHVCVTSDVMCVLCFRAWTQYWVVIHHYTTRSSIQGGSIRNLLLTLSQYFSSLYFANCDANRMPCQCAGKPVGWCKWVLPGVPFGFFGF